jgi:hypothetical protein
MVAVTFNGRRKSMRKYMTRALVVAGLLALVAVVAPASAPAQGGVQVGVLTCDVAAGWGLIFGSSKDLKCTYHPQQGAVERYKGTIYKFGADIGYSGAAVMMWGVWAPSTTMQPGALAGDYGGVTGGATVGVGAAANVLVGGFNKSFSLQPLSVQGGVGLNVAAGVAGMKLEASR